MDDRDASRAWNAHPGSRDAVDLDDPVDSPGEWQRDHIRQYVETGGREGHIWNGVPTLLLTTRGRRSGTARRTPLIYGRDGDRYVVVGSAGGSDESPNWLLNLVVEPRVRVQVGSETFPARAYTAGEDDRKRLWPVMTAIWPDYDAYQQRTDRVIPLVILEREPA